MLFPGKRFSDYVPQQRGCFSKKCENSSQKFFSGDLKGAAVEQTNLKTTDKASTDTSSLPIFKLSYLCGH